jgi:hypothetical protein
MLQGGAEGTFVGRKTELLCPNRPMARSSNSNINPESRGAPIRDTTGDAYAYFTTSAGSLVSSFSPPLPCCRQRLHPFAPVSYLQSQGQGSRRISPRGRRSKQRRCMCRTRSQSPWGTATPIMKLEIQLTSTVRPTPSSAGVRFGVTSARQGRLGVRTVTIYSRAVWWADTRQTGEFPMSFFMTRLALYLLGRRTSSASINYMTDTWLLLETHLTSSKLSGHALPIQ